MVTPQKIEISYKTIVFTVFFLLSLWFVYQISQIIVALFVSIILMSALNPIVDRLERLKFPRWLAIFFVYLIILTFFGLSVAIIVPPLIQQTAVFISKIGIILKNADIFGLGIDAEVINSQIVQLGSIPVNLLKLIINFFSNVVGIFALVIITFYLLLERKNLNKYLLMLFGRGEEAKAEEFVNKVERTLGDWVRGELTLMTIIGLMTFLGLRLLGIEFALPLAIMAGILELVPNIGPIISAIPAVLTGLTISPVMATAVMALYFLVHQTENSLIVPKVMQKVVGINPLVTILSLAVGLKIGGIEGAILAVPVVLVIKVIGMQFFSSKFPSNL